MSDSNNTASEVLSLAKTTDSTSNQICADFEAHKNNKNVMEDIYLLIEKLKTSELEAFSEKLKHLVFDKKHNELIENAKKVQAFAESAGIMLDVDAIIKLQGMTGSDRVGDVNSRQLFLDPQKNQALERVQARPEKVYVRPKPEIKYQNPSVPHEQWTGRGKTPVWLRRLIESGANKEDFRLPDAL